MANSAKKPRTKSHDLTKLTVEKDTHERVSAFAKSKGMLIYRAAAHLINAGLLLQTDK